MAAARLVVALACLGLGIAGWAASRASAAFPGQNGKIAFLRATDGSTEIFVMNADGSGQTPLTNNAVGDAEPSWSPDGQKIAFTRTEANGNDEVYVMNADGSGQTNLTNDTAGNVDRGPAWSPDGTKIAFWSSRNGDNDVYVMNSDGSGQTNLTNSADADIDPAWSPDGTKIAYTSVRDGNGEIYLMNADGSGQTNLTDETADDGMSVWSPDGQRIAFASRRDGNNEIYAMNADGSAPTRLTSDVPDPLTNAEPVDVEPAWSPDGTKIIYRHSRRDSSGTFHSGIFVMNADGSGQASLTNSTEPVLDFQPDWQPIPTACPDVTVGFATAQGCFTETAPGSGRFETDQKAWVGGFEIVPRAGGKLVLDPGAPALSTGGTGADVVFAGFDVPIPVAAIPVGVQDASFEIGQTGTALGVLGIPIESTVQVAWAGDGKSATYEQEVKVEDLTSGIGELVTLSDDESVGESGGKLKASLVNGTGFVLEEGEISIDEVNVIPKALKIKRTLKLKNLLLKFEIKDLKPFWTGQAGIGLPLARGELDVTGTAFAFDGSLAGGGLEVDGINKRVLGPLFLQRAGGDLLFAPEFGVDLGVGATVGPKVGDAELVTLDGTLQGGSLVSDCEDTAARPDPMKLEAEANLSPLEGLEQSGLADVEITTRNCIYPGTGDAAGAIEGTLEGGITFLDVFAYTSTQTGFISTVGASYEGTATLTLPALPDLEGSTILSSVGLAACTDLAFFEGGFGHLWGGPPPQAFSGCDLGPYRVQQKRALARRGPSGGIPVPAGLPHAGFAATGTTGPPLIRVSGPGGFSVESPADGSALVSAEAVIVPVAHENTTYAFVNDPPAGDWQVEALDVANPLTGVSLTEGLPEPNVEGEVAAPDRKSKSKKFRLDYEVREIAGQEVSFTERGEGIARELGTANGQDGTISFKPTLATDRLRTIEAEVIQDGLPREALTIASFEAPPLPKLKVSKLKARRTKSSLALSFDAAPGASEYLVEVNSGAQTLFRVLTEDRKLNFAGTPAKGTLKVAVQAFSESQPAGPILKLKVKPPKKRR